MPNENINNFFELDKVDNLDNLVEMVSKILKNNGVLLTSTDTVYGLLCLPTSDQAIKKIFDMKQRPISRNLPIIVSSKKQAIDDLPILWSNSADKMADKFWPGALTIACGVRNNDLDWLEGRIEVAIRVPNSLFIQKLSSRLGPLLMTSANLHGQDTPHTVYGALSCLKYQPDVIVDGGELNGAPSTLVNINLPEPKIERDGSISTSDILKVLY